MLCTFISHLMSGSKSQMQGAARLFPLGLQRLGGVAEE